MNRDAIERLFYGHALAPAERLFHAALGAGYTATAREWVDRAAAAARKLRPSDVARAGGLVAGAALLSWLPGGGLVGDVIEGIADRGSPRPPGAPRSPGDCEATIAGSILALSSARLMLFEVTWGKSGGAPWALWVDRWQCWTVEQLRASPLTLEEKKLPLGVSWILRLGEPGRPGGYHFSQYPGFPDNREQAAAIAGRISEARRG